MIEETDKGDWEEKTVGSLCQLINGYSFAPEDWTNDGLPII